MGRPHRGQARSHSGSGVFEDFGYTYSTCGSWLARDGGMSGTIDVEWAGPIAGKPAPTVVLGVRRFWVHPLNLWELACQRWRYVRHHQC
ncbi:Secreted protein [Pseudomonas sp. IT-P176]